MTRVDPPFAAGEREMLIAYLDYQRESVVRKVDGLTEEQARSAPSPPNNSILGIMQHLAWVEAWWFRDRFLGEELEDAPWSEEDPDGDFRVSNDRTTPDVVAFYRSEWERANEITRAAASLDDRAARELQPEGEAPTLRWILNHMFEETARHAGHVDIIREMIDGSTGI
jgi:uncharacterized damage-inducible protein DinB